jgi:hypothetical protein
LPQDGVFLSRDPVEGEPAYQYVGGNAVNRVDPSGYFSREAIERSLEGQSIYDAFAKRPGLYFLLRDAQEGSIITPRDVEFFVSQPDFPLLIDRNAVLNCQDNRIMVTHGMEEYNIDSRKFVWRGLANTTIKRYLDYLDTLYSNAFPWRVDTHRLHYYGLHKSLYETTFYDDFGDMTQLPDVRAVGGSVTPGVGGGVEGLIDRYGQHYFTVFGATSAGIPVEFHYREGYVTKWLSTTKDRYRIMGTPEDLKDFLTEFGGELGGGFIGGGQVGKPILSLEGPQLTLLKGSIFWYSIGFTFGFGGSVGYTWHIKSLDNPAESWDWVDRKSKGYNTSDLGPLTDYYLQNYGSPNECNCNQ